VALAFFDFDGTLIRKDSGVICAVPSLRAGLVTPWVGARLIATYLLSKIGLTTRNDAMRVGFECYRGRSRDELRDIVQMLYDRHLVPFVSEPVRRRVEAHRSAGDRLVILTAAASFFPEPIARALGFDDVIGTELLFERGVCTGVVDGSIVEGPAKLEAARIYAAARAEPLEEGAFYGDHPSDLPLLSVVRSPVVVGSHRVLGRVARQRGWPVVTHEHELAVRPT
jgi:HAD superfamily hydrolase (TIGR01490 family)